MGVREVMRGGTLTGAGAAALTGATKPSQKSEGATNFEMRGYTKLSRRSLGDVPKALPRFASKSTERKSMTSFIFGTVYLRKAMWLWLG